MLVRTADVVVRDDGDLGTDGALTDAEVTALNAVAVRVHVTPFGLDGPKHARPATDLTIVAASGQMAITGDESRAPLRIPVPQAMISAAAEGVMGALVDCTLIVHRSGSTS